MSRSTVALALAVLVLGLLPEAASACSACYGGAEESRKAFLLTTVLLMVLPISMIGVLAWFVWRSAQGLEAAHPTPTAEPAGTRAAPIA